jgi:secretion/DNA translocation related CpaE-like protein
VIRPRPLLVTPDADLLDDVLRAAAIAEVEVEVAVDLVAAKAQWSSAPLVLVDAGLAGAAQPALPRRRRLVLVCRGTPEAHMWRDASTIGAETVLALPDAERSLVDRLAECSVSAASRGRVVGVIGGCGGAGATVLAASLALAAARRPVGAMLVDLDPFGGGMDLVFGLEDRRGLRWPDLADVGSRVSPEALHGALPRIRGLPVLSCGRPDQPDLRPESVRAILAAARQCAGFVIVDLPRPPSPAGMAAVDVSDDVLIVVPAEVRAVFAAQRVVAALTPAVDRIWLVVRITAALSPARVAEALALPLVGEIRAERRIRAAADGGRPPLRRRSGPLTPLCDRLLDGWSRNEPLADGAAA